MAAHDIVGVELALFGEIDAFVGTIDDQPLILELAAHVVDRDRQAKECPIWVLAAREILTI